MNIIKCSKGHYYDIDNYQLCPCCCRKPDMYTEKFSSSYRAIVSGERLNDDTKMYLDTKMNAPTCDKCGRELKSGDACFLGVDIDQVTVFCCQECAQALLELIFCFLLIKEEKALDEPAGSDKLWRYMDLAKFISLLSTRKLYFTSIDRFTDIFEGAYCNIENRKEVLDFNRKLYRQNKYLKLSQNSGVMIEMSNDLLTDSDEKILQVMNELMERTGRMIRRSTYVSCWHHNEIESDAMWKLYSGREKDGIAIQTNYSDFKQALSPEFDVKVRKVRYIDYMMEFADEDEPYWYKRKSFEYEKEVRAVITHAGFDLQGIAVPVDLERLISNIYISPYAPIWYYEVVESVLNRFEIHKDLRHSVITKEPYYFSRTSFPRRT